MFSSYLAQSSIKPIVLAMKPINQLYQVASHDGPTRGLVVPRFRLIVRTAFPLDSIEF